jgi:hypothetical protein
VKSDEVRNERVDKPTTETDTPFQSTVAENGQTFSTLTDLTMPSAGRPVGVSNSRCISSGTYIIIMFMASYMGFGSLKASAHVE